MSNRTESPSKTEVVGAPRLAYSMAEAAQAVGVSYITMHRLLKRGRIRAIPGLRTKVIPKAELERFLKV